MNYRDSFISIYIFCFYLFAQMVQFQDVKLFCTFTGLKGTMQRHRIQSAQSIHIYQKKMVRIGIITLSYPFFALRIQNFYASSNQMFQISIMNIRLDQLLRVRKPDDEALTRV